LEQKSLEPGEFHVVPAVVHSGEKDSGGQREIELPSAIHLLTRKERCYNVTLTTCLLSTYPLKNLN